MHMSTQENLTNAYFHHPHPDGLQPLTISTSLVGQGFQPLPSDNTSLYQGQQERGMSYNHHRTEENHCKYTSIPRVAIQTHLTQHSDGQLLWIPTIKQYTLIWLENSHIAHIAFMKATNEYFLHMTTILVQSLEVSTIATIHFICNMLEKKHCKPQFCVFDNEASNTIKDFHIKNPSTTSLLHQKDIKSMLWDQQFRLSKITSSVVYAQQTQISLCNCWTNSYHRLKNPSTCYAWRKMTELYQHMRSSMEEKFPHLSMGATWMQSHCT
ncbi:hypothetical protein ACHAXS_004666 [Conticribra weissflogii]